eukprot:gb/GEZN01012804.1/.p1 GENE.gb/GEZN01012804.1/~~gb/GEZN01012804.1/.p1  ORF type:complete len:125 (-),score=10.08 gb/GEZN01012804.1/:91-465(-)
MCLDSLNTNATIASQLEAAAKAESARQDVIWRSGARGGGQRGILSKERIARQLCMIGLFDEVVPGRAFLSFTSLQPRIVKAGSQDKFWRLVAKHSDRVDLSDMATEREARDVPRHAALAADRKR